MTAVLRARQKRQAVDGVLLLDKPHGLSSNQALQRVKWLLNAQKAGHTGTLDPAATGLLILCFGEATKLAGIGLHEDKTYEACVVLGVSTDSGDAQGKVLSQRKFNGSDGDIEPALAALRGHIEQTPPMHSALKHEGRPLYDYARAGVEIAREARCVVIHELTLLHREASRLHIRVACSKGTYIRVLAEQIGQALGCDAHLESLRRTRIGDLYLSRATTLDALEDLAPVARSELLEAPEILLKSVPLLTLCEDEEVQVRQGQSISRADARPGAARMHGLAGRLIGLAEVAGGVVHPKRILLPPVSSPNLPSIA